MNWSRASLAIRSENVGLDDIITLLGEGTRPTRKGSVTTRRGRTVPARRESVWILDFPT